MGGAVRVGPPPNIWLTLTPLVLVVAVNLVMSQWVLNVLDFSYLATEQFGNTSIERVAGLWEVVVAVSTAIAFILLVNIKDLRALVDHVHEGARTVSCPSSPRAARSVSARSSPRSRPSRWSVTSSSD